MTAVAVLLALALLRVIVVGVGVALLIRPVSACPACFRDTIPIRKRVLALLTSRIEWRWCPHCRWQGPARIVRPARAGVTTKAGAPPERQAGRPAGNRAPPRAG